ncbi:MAG: hypothetical protein KDD43_13785, partial [Bdellovibrionales bacterium]|nr:hypothetical protein [Bdellovibrionales bacterium]
MSEIGVRFPVVRYSDIRLGQGWLRQFVFRDLPTFQVIGLSLCLLLSLPSSGEQLSSPVGDHTFSPNILARKGETFKSFLIRLLPRESVNR